MAFGSLLDSTRPSMSEINVTPLVDVVLVLLIILNIIMVLGLRCLFRW